MERDDLHLSRIDTLWSVVRKAHDGSGDSVTAAQEQLIERYGGAARRYLLAALRDPDAAEEVFQEFALNLARGAFHRANPEHGRFRSFVKTSLFHLIADYRRRQRRRGQERPLDPETPARPTADDELPDPDQAFLQSWRDELLARCWKGLAGLEQTTGKPYHTVLRFRLEHPDMRSAEMADLLSEQLGRPLTAGAVRTVLHRAREAFCDLLLDAVLDSLDEPSLDDAEEELIDLGLLEYCRSGLARRRAVQSAGEAAR